MPYSSSVLCPPLSVTKNPGHLKSVSRSLGKYRSSSSALSRSLFASGVLDVCVGHTVFVDPAFVIIIMGSEGEQTRIFCDEEEEE